MWTTMKTRPKAVTIVAGFLFAATAIAVLVGVSSLFPNPLMDRLWEINKPGAELFRAMGKTAGVLLLALGVGTFCAARGLLQGKRWAWWFAVVLFIVDACGDAVSYFITRDALRSVVGVVVSGTFLVLLMQRRVREWTGQKKLPELPGLPKSDD
jgi:uncharacterized membrane protein YfcA